MSEAVKNAIVANYKYYEKLQKEQPEIFEKIITDNDCKYFDYMYLYGKYVSKEDDYINDFVSSVEEDDFIFFN